MASRKGGLVGRLQEAVTDLVEVAGGTVIDQDRLNLLEASDVERRALQKELDLLGWHVLDYIGGQPQEMRFEERRKLAQQARVVWLQDPQAGAAVDLMNDFVLGRGVPKPKCADEKVQEVVDEAWDDPDNQNILTSYVAQVALNTDLSLQSNLFVLIFADGDDGKVKLSLLDHDAVENAVRDEDDRHRVLYYVARERRVVWDYQNDRPVVLSDHLALPSATTGNRDREVDPGRTQKAADPRVRYYEHFRNVKVADEEGRTLQKPPEEKLGKGRVYHIAINRTTEQVFGYPTMRRTIKWYAAYNDFMRARVDMAQAAAAFIMKRKIKGGANQVAKMAAKAVSRRSDLVSTDRDPEVLGGPKPASILNENDSISHENFALNTNAGQALQDAQMLRAQISAATRFPQTYYGDASNSNLATATSLELPVLKAVEARQELLEGLFRHFVDTVIERAVDAGRIPTELTEEERAKLKDKKNPNTPEVPEEDMPEVDAATGQPVAPTTTQQAYEHETQDEEATERDLSYELSMPNPLKRTLTDLIGAIANIARTFDPNNTNLELSRVLLTIAFGEGLELEDPAKAVERIYPEGYVDPAVEAAMQQEQNSMDMQAQQEQMAREQAMMGEPPGVPGDANFFAPEGEQAYSSDPANPYSAPGQSTNYKKKQGQIQQAAIDVPSAKLRKRGERIDELWEDEVSDLAAKMLSEAGDLKHGNGLS